MGDLVIKNVEDETIVQITRLANLHGHSIERETLTLIQHALGRTAIPEEDRATMARRIAAMTPKNVVQTDSVFLIREDRDR